MKSINFQLDFSNRAIAQKQVLMLLEALINMNRFYLINHPNTPKIYEADVSYISQGGSEDWFDIGEALKQGGGDCKILTAWRIAELRERNKLGWKSVRPFIKWKTNADRSFYLYHALVLHSALIGGQKVHRLEDPSKILGMDEVLAGNK